MFPSTLSICHCALWRHWLAVLRGETTASAPAEYVAGLFDGYADRFDEHLVETLEYRTPELLSQELVQARPRTWQDT